MITIVDKSKCCGCNACGDVCAHKAITFKTDIEGFWYPEVDTEKCKDCGLCEKVCPVIHSEELKTNDFKKPLCFAANHKNLEIRFDSTSGGGFTALAEDFLNAGGYVGGAVYTDDWNVKQIVTNDINDLPKLRSSKYIQSDASGYYKTIKRLLSNGEKVLAVGLPCQIGGLKAFLCKDYANLITIDLICRYINSPKVYKKYLESLEKEYKSKVVYIKAKNKELGWRKLTHKVVFANGSTYYGTFDIDKFMKASMRSNCLSRPSCYECKFKGFPRIADITLGDYWVRGQKTDLDDNTGTSIILINSEKGKNYFESIKKRLKRIEVPFESVLPGNPALLKPLPGESVDRNLFYQRMETEDFNTVVDTMCATPAMSTKHKIKNIFKAFKKQYKMAQCHLTPWLQFFYLNFFHPGINTDITKGYLIFTTPYCIFDISKKAKIELNGYFEFGRSIFKKSKLESRLRMQDGAKMIIGNLGCGGYAFGYGSDIEIFKNATLISKGGPSTNMNTTIICQDKIVIGQEVAIGRDVTIRDNNGGHQISIYGYKNALPVVIGEHVWLCQGCTIMSGVKIGNGSIVGADSLVNKSLPPHVVVSGNPARITLENINWKM